MAARGVLVPCGDVVDASDAFNEGAAKVDNSNLQSGTIERHGATRPSPRRPKFAPSVGESPAVAAELELEAGVETVHDFRSGLVSDHTSVSALKSSMADGGKCTLDGGLHFSSLTQDGDLVECLADKASCLGPLPSCGGAGKVKAARKGGRGDGGGEHVG